MHPDSEKSGGEAGTAAAALRIDGLRKTFGAKTAVDDVSLVVPTGSFFGLVGPNGAGKTTMLSMAVGLLRPDAGTVELLGADVWADPVRAKELLGVLPDGLALPERLTGRELLAFAGSIRGMAPDVVAQRSAELLAVLELDGDDATLVIDYSTGMRKKIGLAVALLHRPRLLVLDEPLEAVDPVSSATIKSILRAFVDAGGSVVFSSHVMAVVEQLCDHVGVLAGGRVLASGPMAEVGSGGLEQRFMDLVGTEGAGFEGLQWLAT
ncbi:ABC transporter ATP-binding protein [Streptomonospora litoralis]|uniref:Daunorubicin/doxorubicin resistance ATP-binding protein DrrA n=1 Tax=Streptomonospora litoralis TaxID=2498135 RepID=A0A4P6Q029_9ACTN|nr:ABC transporter ATP-binding protein [Streptomonospora litoralis]QBI53956.1 Daunorubicin/doxorubicin resistance ATP-binding protein DrrA [Streptomonospora litoralis]